MTLKMLKIALLVSAVGLAGCNNALDSVGKADKPLPPAIINAMKAKGMSRTSPIMVRIFKEEGELEVWKKKHTGRYDLIAEYEICKWSGKLGPKFLEGDRQAPEGFYTVRPAQMNPNSRYHLAFNIGYPNNFDRAHGRTGSHLMVHGACSSAGCYSMTDEQVSEIYAFARDAFRGGQRDFQIQAFPFRMSAENMARYRNDPNYKFWTMLKEGHDHFELTKTPPKVDVCSKRYVFNRLAEEGHAFDATAQCPPMSQPDNLRLAYENHSKTYQEAFSKAITTSGYSTGGKPLPSIAGFKEAALVADWSKRRARGERVSRQPPSLARPAASMSTEETSLQPTTPVVQPQIEIARASTEAPAPTATDVTAAPPVPTASPGVAAQPEKKRRIWNVFSD